jgi:hypothetical protein
MKKLQFKLEGKEMLSKEQMKKISGGSGTCAAFVPGSATSVDFSCYPSSAPVCYQSGGGSIIFNITEDQASCLSHSVYPSGGHWCCTSCSSASWYYCP